MDLFQKYNLKSTGYNGLPDYTLKSTGYNGTFFQNKLQKALDKMDIFPKYTSKSTR